MSEPQRAYDPVARIAELEAAMQNHEEEMVPSLTARIAELEAAVLAEREACAAWHDAQIEQYRKWRIFFNPRDPIDDKRMQDFVHIHKCSAAAIRARPAL